MKIAFTGHRPTKLNNDYDLTSDLVVYLKIRILEAVQDIGMQGNITFITGMALGIDTLAAQIAVEYNIPFIAAIPFKGQYLAWPRKSQDLYFDLLNKAQHIVVCDTGQALNWQEYLKLPNTPFSSNKMQKRNEWMVNNCDKLIAVWDGSSGGTANCVHYAEREIEIGKLTVPQDQKPLKKVSIDEIIRINPNDFK